MGEIKIKTWDGEPLPGPWLVTYKIDGVRAFLTPEGARSRADKPLYNLGTFLPSEGERDVEVYLGSFEDSISAVRTQTHKDIPVSAIYSLSPIDHRLIVGGMESPDAVCINKALDEALKLGYEGLVLRNKTTWIKVKPIQTFDVQVTAIIEGEGQHEGRMGALRTAMGKVGTGFTVSDRNMWWKDRGSLVGSVIEVECMQLTPDGKFRHPRYLRQRPDHSLNKVQHADT